MLIRAVVCTLLLAALAPLPAQDVCYQENGGTGFNDAFFSGPGGISAVKIAPPAALLVGGVEIFTGEVTGTGFVTLWRHDALNDQPLTRLAESAFGLATPDGWQGATFAAAVPLSAGGTYWVSWTLPLGAQSPIDSPKQTLGQFYRTSADGGATWFGPFQFNNSHFKFRLLGDCGPCAGFTVAYGTGTPGASLPTLLAGGCPGASHTLALMLGNAPPNAPALLLLGLGTDVGLVKGCVLQNLPLLPLVVPFQSGPAGSAVLSGTLPAVVPPGLLNAQVLVADPSAAGGASASNPVQIAMG